MRRVNSRTLQSCRRMRKRNRIALAFHRKAQHRARQLVRLHGVVAYRLERQPRFVESSFQNDERLRIEGAVVDASP